MHCSLRDCDPLAELVLVEQHADRLALLDHHARQLLSCVDRHRALSALWQRPRLPICRILANILRVGSEVRARESRILRFAVAVDVDHPAGQPLRRAPGVDEVPLVLPADAALLAVAKGLKEVTLLVVFLTGETRTGLRWSVSRVSDIGLEAVLQVACLRRCQLYKLQQN